MFADSVIRLRWSILMGLGSIWMLSCSTEFEVFAPEEKIWAVYGVLNPDKSHQDIRISQVFQLEGDAIEFSKTFDPSVSGLTVWLEGGGEQFPAQWVDSIIKLDTVGAFGPTLGLYRIQTPEGLIPDETYTLRIHSEQDTSLRLSAYTRIPPKPRIISPRVVSGLSDYCLRVVPFEDSTAVLFSTHTSSARFKALRYEIRIRMRYTENSIPKTFVGGPTNLFAFNEGCSDVRPNTRCFLFEKGWILRSLQNAFRDTSNVYGFRPEPSCAEAPSLLSQAVSLEVASVDTFLSRYMIANDPRFLNLNDYRREYTNIVGTQRGVGIFGSIATDESPISLTPCGLYILGLGPRPFGICE